MEIVGIDVGFGFTKACNGKNSVIFKSIIGDATDIQFRSVLGDEPKLSNIHITFEDKSYFIGQYAELQSNIREFTLEQDKLLDQFFRILAVTAAGLCTDAAVPLNVVTGLPVGFLRRDSRKLKELITGVHHITFHHPDGQNVTRKIQIEQVHVIPQPIGSIFNLIFDDQGRLIDKGLAAQKLGVVDIGFKTTDFSIFDRLQYVERGSTTMDTGISKCFSVIAAKLRQESNINIELFRLFKFIESEIIKIRGREYNISNLKKRVYAHAAGAIAADLNRLWENDWDMDSIILSGGGSVELAEYLAPGIEGHVIPIPRNLDARFNNVQGYCKFGRYKWGYARFVPEPGDTPPRAIREDGPVTERADTQASPPPSEASAGNEKTSRGLFWIKRSAEQPKRP